MQSCRLYLITPPRVDDVARFAEDLARALDGGDVACLQIRLKDEAGAAPDDHVLRTTEAALRLARPRDLAVLVNDRPDLARRAGADGVHIGQTDASFDEARRILGRDASIGVTCHDSMDLAIAAADAGADYVAFGAFFPTATKDAPTRADFKLLRSWSFATVVPCVAIGGVTPDNCAPLVASGADFIAASAAIWCAPDGPGAAVAAFNAAIATALGARSV
ncbi:MAG: thiamine phosphate synthase [Parvularculaceae bacterium]|nr:thiamine phosphate synthase [Parvularculaceae bacterium]